MYATGDNATFAAVNAVRYINAKGVKKSLSR